MTILRTLFVFFAGVATLFGLLFGYHLGACPSGALSWTATTFFFLLIAIPLLGVLLVAGGLIISYGFANLLPIEFTPRVVLPWVATPVATTLLAFLTTWATGKTASCQFAFW